MEKKLSFVIPVYNVEAYLEECVLSIASQCNEECEIILVDDGSTDSSGQICDKLAYDYACVKVIHKENAGVSAARNTGMELASGAYIAFVDSDDRIATNSVKKLLTWIGDEGADICFLDAIKFYPNGKTEPMGDAIDRSGVYHKSREETLPYLASRPKFPGSVWGKLFRRDFLQA